MRPPRLLQAVVLSAVALWSAPSAAQEWKPSRPVEFVVASGSGGSLDQVARMLKQILEKQGALPNMIVSNRPAGAGLVAMNTLEQHPGDAHYVASWAHQWLTNYVTGEWKLSPLEFTVPAILFNEYVGLAVRAESPIRNATDLVERLRKDPASVTIGVATALGNHIHIGAAKPLKAAGVDVGKLTVVPFKSSADSVVAAMGGHIDVVAATTPNLVAQMQSGRLRVLAVSSPRRLGGAFAEVPTWKDQGVDAEFASAQGVMAPKNLSAAQVDYWTRALREAVETPEWQAFVQRNQWTPRFLAGDDAKRFVQSELTEMRAILRDLGMAKQ